MRGARERRFNKKTWLEYFNNHRYSSAKFVYHSSLFIGRELEAADEGEREKSEERESDYVCLVTVIFTHSDAR